MQQNLINLGIDAEFLYKSLADSCDDYLYIWNIEEDCFWASDNMVKDFALSSSFITGFSKEWLSKIHEKDLDRVHQFLQDLSSGNLEEYSLEYQVRNAAGHYIWAKSKGTLKLNSERCALAAIGTLHNLESEGRVDSVTGLHGHEKCRQYFDSILETNEKQGTVLLLGIDNFSNINALNTREFGDMVLRTTVRDIQKLLPAQTVMYRLDGDRFIVLADGIPRETILETYDQIQAYANDFHQINEQIYQFTVSAGIITYPDNGKNWPDLEKGLSAALKLAKESGKNRCVEFTEMMLKESVFKQSMSRILADSVNNGFQGFRAVFQPVCEANLLRVKGAEALLRFDMGQETLSPLAFIPLLESTHLIIPVGLWILEQAIMVCKQWIEYVPDFVMNVNISHIQLHDPLFYEKIEALLEQYQLDSKHLTLELTESYFTAENANFNFALDKLEELHLQLAMDNFGTGYSALARLTQFHVDVVKIDNIFIKSVNQGDYNYDFIESVVRLCHNAGMKVCVEGVETEEEQRSIHSLDIDFIQGFYISKPINKIEFYKKFIQDPMANDALVISRKGANQNQQLVNDKDLMLAMMNATPLSLNLWNQDAEIIACNDEVLNLLGAEDYEDLQQNFFQFSPAKQPDGVSSEKKASEKITEAFEKGRSTFFWMHCKRNGEPIPAEVVSVRVPYKNDYIVASYTRDLSEQINMEKKNKKFHLRLQAILDATPLCVNLWNSKFENTMCNQEAVELFELKSKDEYIKRFFELSPERQPGGMLSLDMALEKISEAFEEGRTQFSWTHCMLDGQLIPTEITLVKIKQLDDHGQAMVAGYTRDMRPQIQAEQAERTAAHRVKAMIDSMPLACLTWNEDIEIIDCNQIAVSMFGAVDKQELIDRFDSFMPEHQPDGMPSLVKKMEKFKMVYEQGSCVFEWMYMDRNGDEIPSEVKLVKVSAENEDIVVAYSRDLRELRNTLELNEKLTKIAFYDALTGCASRASFTEALLDNYNKIKADQPFAFIIIDLDYFKHINDTYGHDAGDMTLKKVVTKIQSLLPDNALLGRYGGDEFVVQIKEIQKDQLESMIDSWVTEISNLRLQYGDDIFTTSISIGATLHTPEDKGVEDFVKRADGALYAAKDKGRNCAVVL